MVESIILHRSDGNAFVKQGQYENALDVYERLLLTECEDEKYLLYSNISFVQLKLGLIDQALISAQKCKDICPETFRVKCMIRIAHAYQAMRDFSNAQSALTQALKWCQSPEEESGVEQTQRLFYAQEKESIMNAQKLNTSALNENHKDQLQKQTASDDIDRFLRMVQSEKPRNVGKISKDKLESNKKVLLQVEITNDATVMNVSYEWFGNHVPKDEDDVVALYPAGETDPAKFWNVQEDVGGIRKGTFAMRVPGVDGVFCLRYMTEQGRRCVGQSCHVRVEKSKIYRSQPPYLLLREPNLLCYWLYLPLLPGTVNLRGIRLNAHVTSSEPDCRIPTMTVENKTNVIILAPTKCKLDNETHLLVPYINVILEDEVDLDRSTLSFHGGDFLAARLAFSNMSSGASAKSRRMLLHPRAEEFEDLHYRNGLKCRACGECICQPLSRHIQATATPWVDLLGHLTCVAPEDYRNGSEGLSRAFENRMMDPEAEMVVIDDAFVEISPSDVMNTVLVDDLAFFKTLVAEASRPGECFQRAVQCAQCSSFLGYGVFYDDDTPLKYQFYKVFINTETELYNKTYVDMPGCFIGSQLQKLCDLGTSRNVIVQRCSSPPKFLQLGIWSTDSWAATRANPDLSPVIKVTYQQLEDIETSSQVNFFLMPYQYDLLYTSLIDSTNWLPESARFMGDASLKIGFLFW